MTPDEKEKILELVEELFVYYKEDDWLKVKKYLVRYSHPTIRTLFSTRNSKSKKHQLNSFEENLIDIIYLKYNRELKLYEKDKHKNEA
tara:strand:+ start:5285 stop:5548 length:264 start_codon:yes stop_codon:yes gene_type:complete